MTSATERVRELLDERGVEWTEPTDEYWELLGGMPTRNYVTIIGEKCVEEALDGTLVVYRLTPEQAIAAALGRGTCKYVGEDADNIAGIVFRCSKCGNVEWPRPRNYCPECGRRVVD